MKKIIFLIVSIYNLNISGYGQEWIRIYGQGMNAVARDVKEDYDKGFDIAGMVNNYTYAWLIKTDVNGNMLWNQRFGNGNYLIATENVEKTNDGGYILCGTTEKYGSYDAYLLKLNACAEPEWCKVIETPDNPDDMGIKVKQTPEGDYVMLCGYFVTEPFSNISLFKFKSTGELIWHKFYPMGNLDYNDEPNDLLIDTDGYLITADRYYPDPGTTSPGILRSYFSKTDTAGNEVWNLVYGTNDYYYSWPWETIKNQYGNYYNTCTHTDFNTGDNPAIIKVLHGGTESYNHDIVTTNNFNLSGMGTIDVLNDTNFVMAGGWILNNIQTNVFIKTDTLGNLIKTKELPLTTYGAISTAKTKDNKFLSVSNDATGGTWKIYAFKVNSNLEYDSIYTIPYMYDSLCPHPIVSDTVDPDCENEYVDIEEPFTSPETTKLKVFPNPSSDKVTIEMPKYLVLSNAKSKIPSTTIYHQWKSVMLEVYDIAGKKVMEREINKSETKLDLDVSEWGKGMYAFRLVYQKQEVGNAKVVVQ